MPFGLRWKIGALVLGFGAICFVAGFGAGVVATPLALRLQPTMTPAQAAASFDRRWQAFTAALAARPSEPASVTITAQEANARLREGVNFQWPGFERLGVQIVQADVDFVPDRLVVVARLRLPATDQTVGVRARLRVIPVRAGEAIRLETDQIDLTDVAPIAIPIGLLGGAQELPAPCQCRVQQIVLRNGELVMTAVGR